MSTPPHEPPSGGEQQGPQPGEQASAAAGQEAPHCPRCGAPHDPLQEYCLECGQRLVPLPAERYTREIVWSRESPVWLWLALGSLLLVALAAGAIVALAATDDEPSAAPASSGTSTLGPPTASPPTLPTTIPTVETLTTPSTATFPTTSTSPTTTTFPTTTGTTGSTTTSPTTTGSTTIIPWPSGEDGYSVFLKSTPTSEGRGPADSAAQRAISNGLRDVGVLNSSSYSSLNPGYYVTFTGVYDTRNEAENALPRARNSGFPTAYVREVSD